MAECDILLYHNYRHVFSYPHSIPDVDPGVVEHGHLGVALARSKAKLLHCTSSCLHAPVSVGSKLERGRGRGRERAGEREGEEGGAGGEGDRSGICVGLATKGVIMTSVQN